MARRPKPTTTQRPRAVGVALVIAVSGIVAVGVSRRSPPAEPEPVVRSAEPWTVRAPTRFATDPDRSEDASSTAGQRISAQLLEGVKRGDPTRVAELLSTDFSGRPLDLADGSLIADSQVELRELSTKLDPVDGAAWTQSMIGLVANWAAVERAYYRPFVSLLHTSADGLYQEAHFGLAGHRPDGQRAEISGTVAVELRRDTDWRVARWTFIEARVGVVSLPPFRDVSGEAGFGFNFSEATQSRLQTRIDEGLGSADGGGLTALDYDGDGFVDLIASRPGRAAVLFLNDRVGGFQHDTLPGVTRPEESANHYLWVDLDNDGKSELVGSGVVRLKGGEAELGLYASKGKGKGVRRLQRALTFESGGFANMVFQSLVACDVNGDQLLDLVALGHNPGQVGAGESHRFIDARHGLRNLLFINRGGLRFEEQGLAAGLDATRYTLVAECHDFDRDGDVDLLFGNDFAPNDYYVNDGTGRFRRDPQHPFASGLGFSMGVSMADWDNTGVWSVSVSNMYSHAGHRILKIATGLSPPMQARLQATASGNTLFASTGGGAWQQNAQVVGVDRAEWAWGQQFFDLDNDQDQDLYVVNGFRTHRDPKAPDF